LSATAASLTKLLAWRPGGYLRASGALFGWLAVRTLAQTVLFVLVARTLGADGYGSLLAVMAIATFLAPLTDLGGSYLLLRDGARNPDSLATHLGNTLRLWGVTIAPFCILAYVLCEYLLPPTLSPFAVAAVLLADLVGMSLLELLVRMWQSAQRVFAFGAIMTGLSIIRLLVFYLLTSVMPVTPDLWAIWYGAVTVCYVLLVTSYAIRTFGRPILSGASLNTLIRSGFPFAFVASAMRIQTDSNKPLLARLESSSGAGILGASQRITDLILLPIQAMIVVLTPRAYRTAAPTLKNIFMLGIPSLVVALIGGVIAILCAPWLPTILGDSYAHAVALVQLLAFLPCAVVVRLLLNTLLSAQNRQQAFYLIYAPGVTVGVLSTVFLIVLFGVTGAAAGAYVSELAIVSFQAAALISCQRKPPRPPQTTLITANAHAVRTPLTSPRPTKTTLRL
jgi:O-antigen/teichoic acid export membrane protein